MRLTPANAEKLFALVEEEGVLNTTVILTGTRRARAPARGDAAARRMRVMCSRNSSQQYGPRYGSNQPAYGNPYYAQPHYAQPQYAQPQYAQPYAQPQYAQPQYGQPTYAQPQYVQPQRPVYVDPYGRPYQRPGTPFPY